MKKTAMTALACLLLTLVFPTAAHAQELALGGQIVGIRLQTDGILVAGLSAVETAAGSVSPAAEAGVKPGDRITAVNGRPITVAGELIEAVAAANGESVELSLCRGDDSLTLQVKPALTGECQWMLGMLLRDGIAGIGTLTFCDPETGIYGALGHSVSDEDSGAPLPLRQGSITDAEVVGVSRGAAGSPGELNGCADENQVLGTVDKNSACGIYGHAVTQLGGRRVETGEVVTGPATILSTVDGREQQEFAVEITRIFHDGEGCHVILEVTDPALRELTGGIVQGMSGSPILQNGKLVAAVTHVFLSDPCRGYGLSIQDMLAEADLLEDQAA